MSFNLATIVREQAKHAPDRPAVHARGLIWTCRELDGPPEDAAGTVLTTVLRERP